VNQFWRRDLFWPILLIIVGTYFLLHNLGWIRDDIFWPLVLIGIGVWLILRRART
jgi:LiaI-LiaF-like transmembrane region